MKRILLVYLLFIVVNWNYGQELSIGSWRTHMSFNKAFSLAEDNGKIYCANGVGVFLVDEGNEINILSTEQGMTTTGAKTIAFNKSTKTLIIGYEDSNIDLYKDGNFINLSGIKRSNIQGNKSINKISTHGNFAYVCTKFGIVVVDLVRQEIKDTYYPSIQGETNSVNDVAVLNGKIYAGTESGLFVGDISETINLSSFENWRRQSSGVSTFVVNDLEIYENTIYVAIASNIYKETTSENWTQVYGYSSAYFVDMTSYQDELYITLPWAVEVWNPNDGRTAFYTDPNVTSSSKETIVKSNGDLLIADSKSGLLEYKNNIFSVIKPNGPYSQRNKKVHYANGSIWVASGTISLSNQPSFHNDGLFEYKDYSWTNYNKFIGTSNTEFSMDTLWDMANVIGHPNGSIYAASYIGGIAEFKDGELVNIFKYNTSMIPSIGTQASFFCRGLALDSEDKIWVTNYNADKAISVFDPATGQWESFNIASKRIIDEILVDNNGYKWIENFDGSGILVYDSGEDDFSNTDDDFRLLNMAPGADGQSNNSLRSIIMDKEGDIWVGTERGITVFDCASSVFTQNGCQGRKIFRDGGEDDFNNFLLEGEAITAIAVDGANRKWIGTENGVFLVSEDGKEDILAFDEDNSPLLSNKIISITINEENGEVFFGTEKGIISYKGDATEPVIEASDVLVYPNPVAPDYNGPIAIKGLPANATFKITDISGQLVFEGNAFGGQAIWDGRNYNGDKSSSGVYLVFISNFDGSQTQVGKILFIK